jgi:hypothetical protein
MQPQTPQLQVPLAGSSQASDGTQLDPTAVALSRAIRQVESQKNYEAKGASGEFGAYQWMPNNFETAATKYGLDPSDKSPVNQDKVAYHQIKEQLDAGHKQSEIASWWNSGKYDATGNVGVNKEGVKFDTPAYVENVKNAYLRNTNGQNQTQQFNQKPFSQPTGNVNQFSFDTTGQTQPTSPQGEKGLVQQLNERGQDFSNATQMTAKGDVVSGVLQMGGALGGAIGDVVNKGLELIPGVKAIEGVIGSGIGKLAQTEPGQAILKSVKDWSDKNPELAKDAEAGFNILTAIPILKGLGIVKNLALDSASMALKNVAEKTALKDFTSTIARNVEGRNALASGAEADIKTLIAERAIPEIENGKYATKEAFNNLETKISEIENTKFQPILEKGGTTQVADRIPLETYKQKAMADAVSQLKETKPIENYFDRLKAKYGDYMSLGQVNEAKRIVANNIKEASFASPTFSTDKLVRSTLQQAEEDAAKSLGLTDLIQMKQAQQKLIKAQNILEFIEGKPVKTGMVSGMIKDVSTVGGEMAGNATGIPLAGAYIGREGGGYVGKKLIGITTGILKRTAPEYKALTKSQLAKYMSGLFGGAVSQKTVKSK